MLDKQGNHVASPLRWGGRLALARGTKDVMMRLGTNRHEPANYPRVNTRSPRDTVNTPGRSLNDCCVAKAMLGDTFKSGILKRLALGIKRWGH